jgi:hypothetical protein
MTIGNKSLMKRGFCNTSILEMWPIIADENRYTCGNETIIGLVTEEHQASAISQQLR